MGKPMPVKKEVQVFDHVATGRAYRTARRALDLSQESIATRMGVSAVFLHYLELGKRNWTDDLCQRFQKALQEK